METMEASQFVLRDSKGRLRAALRCDENDFPNLFFFDAQAKPRLIVAEQAGGAMQIALTSESGKPIAGLGIDLAGIVSLHLTDPTSTSSVTATVQPDGMPGLMLKDANEISRLSLQAKPDSSQVVIADGQGRPRAILIVTERNVGLVVLDEQGVPRHVFPTPPSQG